MLMACKAMFYMVVHDPGSPPLPTPARVFGSAMSCPLSANSVPRTLNEWTDARLQVVAGTASLSRACCAGTLRPIVPAQSVCCMRPHASPAKQHFRLFLVSRVTRYAGYKPCSFNYKANKQVMGKTLSIVN